MSTLTVWIVVIVGAVVVASVFLGLGLALAAGDADESIERQAQERQGPTDEVSRARRRRGF